MDYLNVTDVVENAFCRKFTYYTHVLQLKQYEEKRGSVLSGRKVHETHEKRNKDYPTGVPGGTKLVGLRLFSEKLGIVGKIDEAVETDDEIVLVERKYSDHHTIGDSLRAQIGLLAMLIEENKNKPVRRAIIMFSKGAHVRKEVTVDEELRNFAAAMLSDTRRTIEMGIAPPSQFDGRCLNCCFRKICPTGLLNTN